MACASICVFELKLNPLNSKLYITFAVVQQTQFVFKWSGAVEYEVPSAGKYEVRAFWMVFQRRTGPAATWSFAVGADTPTQRFPEATESGAVLESSSMTESTILFHPAEPSTDPEDVLSETDNPEVSAA